MPTYSIKPAKEFGIEIDRDDPDITLLGTKSDTGPVFNGEGDTDYVCDNCKTVLIEDVNQGQVQDVGFDCHGCGEILYLPAHDP